LHVLQLWRGQAALPYLQFTYLSYFNEA